MRENEFLLFQASVYNTLLWQPEETNIPLLTLALQGSWLEALVTWLVQSSLPGPLLSSRSPAQLPEGACQPHLVTPLLHTNPSHHGAEDDAQRGL